MSPPCDAERHYHDLTAYTRLLAGKVMAADCICGSASLIVASKQGAWAVSLLDGTSVLGPLASDSLVSTVDTELVIGIRRPASEG